MDTTAFLTIVIILVSIILTAVGIYLILLLHEARNSIKRLNKILDRVEGISNFLETKIVRPTAGFSNVIYLLKEGLDFFNEIKRTINKPSEREQ